MGGRLDPINIGKVYFTCKPNSFSGTTSTGHKGLDMTVHVTIVDDSIPGDLDGNGTVDIQDVMAACRVLARQNGGTYPTAEEIAQGDLTGDGYIRIEDIMAICRLLAQKA